MIRFAAPEWFILVPLLATLMWYRPQLALWRPLRMLLLLLLLGLLVQPQIILKSGGLNLWVLVDQSLSVEDEMAKRLPEWEALLKRSKPARDKLHLIDFASDVEVRGANETGLYGGLRNESRLALALQYVLARQNPREHNRILVLSDGFSTEPVASQLERLMQHQTAVDFRLLRLAASEDYRINRLTLPQRVQPDEPFLVEVEVQADGDGEVPLRVQRGNTVVHQGVIALKKGQGTFRFADQLGEPGAHRYRVELLPKLDAFAANNIRENWVEVAGGKRILLLTSYQPDPLQPILGAQGFDVRAITDGNELDIGDLSGARAVIFNNFPAYRVPQEFLKALPFFVTEQGGGLLMAGGEFSFGAGGYFESAIDELLPVSMELRSDHRKLSVAMAIVLDRSGSMAAMVTGGGTKMDLANTGAARSVELLGDRDLINVLAVDSEPHEMVPLVAIEGRRGEIIDQVLRITSQGGGIYVYTGLKAAWENLKAAGGGQKHIILFADAADAEEPGEYEALLKEMRKENATLSVIALGTEFDPDANFLKDAASKGGGRIFFSANPADVPAVFAQETVAVARSAFIKEPVELAASGSWNKLSTQPIEWLAAVDGYNLSYLRARANAAILSLDEYEAPLFSFWNRGVGHVAAVTFPLAGQYSALTRGWSQYGDFLQTVVRWLAGSESPEGVVLQTDLLGSELNLNLFYSDQWTEKFAVQTPRLLVKSNIHDRTEELVWELFSPGHYVATKRLSGVQQLRGALQAGNTVLPFGPAVLGSDPEWDFERERVTELKVLADKTAGVERQDLTSIWNAPRHGMYQGIQLWLALLLLCAFLVEALLARSGYQLPSLGRVEWLPQFGRISFRIFRRKRSIEESPDAQPAAENAPPAATAQVEPERRKSLFQEAKHSRKR